MDKKEHEKQKENKNEIDSKFKSPYTIKTRNKHPEVIDRADLFKDHNLKEARNGIVFKVNRDSIRELALMKEKNIRERKEKREKALEMEEQYQKKLMKNQIKELLDELGDMNKISYQNFCNVLEKIKSRVFRILFMENWLSKYQFQNISSQIELAQKKKIIVNLNQIHSKILCNFSPRLINPRLINLVFNNYVDFNPYSMEGEIYEVFNFSLEYFYRLDHIMTLCKENFPNKSNIFQPIFTRINDKKMKWVNEFGSFIRKNSEAYDHYKTGIALAEEENLSEPLRRAEELSNDDEFSKFLVDATAGKINLKEEEIGRKKEGEFNEKVPMVVALDKSTKLFNEGNYEKAIALLEGVLNQDPSKDFTASIRYDVWYNLSVIYILTNQFDKAFDAIVNFMKEPEYTPAGYRVFFNEELTESQKKMLMSNYRFESLFFFMDSSKWRKEFKLFVQELGKKLNQIEENANGKKFTDIINELNFLKEIILYFVGYDPYGKCIYSDEILVNISNKVQDLINHYVDKENESIIKTFEEDLSNAKEMIKKSLISEAEIKLNDILDNYFNFHLSSSGSGSTDDANREWLKVGYYSDDNFKKVIDPLILIKENELEKLPEEKRLEKYLLSFESLSYKYRTDQTTIYRMNLGKKPLKLRQLAKEDFRQEMRIREYIETCSNQNIELASVSEIMSIPSKYRAYMKDPITKKDFRKVMNTTVNPINETYENLKKRVNDYNITNNIQRIDNIPELITFLKEGDMLIQAFSLNYFEDFDFKRFDDLVIQFYSYYFDFNPYEADHQFISYILDSLRKLKGKHYRFRRHIITNNFLGDDLTNVFDRYENLNFDSMKLEYLKKVSDEIREYNFDVPVENLFNFLLDFSKVIPLKGSDQLTEESNELEYKIKSVKYLGTLYFKIIEKEENKKIIYYYDFSKSDIKEKGKLYLNFVDLKSGKVILKIRNEIYESLGRDIYLNWISTNLKSWIDQNIGKIVAKVVQTIIYEKTLENLTMGNYRILQARINTMGKNIEDLKNKFFEVKAPLTLTSFNCSECGATLNITSKEEKFIICEHCSTPFLMEWQKG